MAIAATTFTNRVQAEAAERRATFLAGSVIVAAVIFNGVFAILNGHLVPLNERAVIAAEVALFFSAIALALRRYQPAMTPWFLLMGFATLLALLRFAGLGHFAPKYLRDALLIPTFIVLGMTVLPERIATAIIVATCFVLAGMVLEAVALPQYRELFQVQQYYIATRGIAPEAFWETDIGLYPSALREDRMLPFVDLHRLSSVFLEPVSMGNYCAFLLAYLLACGGKLSRRTYWFLLFATIAILIGCDGRLAVVGMLLIFGVAVIAPYLPAYSEFWYLPFAVVAVCLVTWIGDLNPVGNDFPSRLAYTVMLFENFGPLEYFGLSDQFATMVVDSGIAYWLTTQSLIGVVVIWTFFVFGSRHDTVAQVRYSHSIALYLSVTMLVSASFVSIKTAALMWFIHGALQNDRGPLWRRGQAHPQKPGSLAHSR